ncbi:TPA: acyl-ACP--UDP-N-acetylglucosamine O-acyltransferase [Candidatus Poribacteria bacterium]|nr:acyl-ACP--UDP-N-acetylglucosamine O-acyltransferase [Candidatus Poribacteria bacterium]
MRIHETAIVHPKAEIGDDVEIGPFSIIDEDVKIGARTKIGPYVHIKRWSTIGEDCNIYESVVIGSEPKDLKHKPGDRSFVIIGDRNNIHEYTSIARATGTDQITRIGDDNLLMAYVHVAHDCVIGNKTILASFATLGGHVMVEDRAIIGAQSSMHQFVRIGTLAFAGACAKIVQDVPPYIIADGYPASVRCLNTVGLIRNGMPSEKRLLLKRAFRILFRSNLNRSQAIDKVRKEVEMCEEIEHLLEFIESSKRGIGV